MTSRNLDLASMDPEEWPLLLAIPEVCAILRLSRGATVKLIDEGVLDERRFGSLNRRHVTRASVQALIEGPARRASGEIRRDGRDPAPGLVAHADLVTRAAES